MYTTQDINWVLENQNFIGWNNWNVWQTYGKTIQKHFQSINKLY